MATKKTSPTKKKAATTKKAVTTKKAAPRTRKAASKPVPTASVAMVVPASPAIVYEIQAHDMIRASQDGKIAILQVLRSTKRPMTIEELRVGLEQIGVELDTDTIEIHLLFLSDPSVNLVRLLPGTDPLQCQAV